MHSSNYSLNSSKFLNNKEVEHLNKIISNSYSTGNYFIKRNSLMLKTALSTGARASELLLCEWNHLDLENNSLFIRGIKGSLDRELPLKKDLVNCLYQIKREEDQEKIFNISYPRLVQIWHEFRPVKKKFHSLRHTFALSLYKKSKDIRLVQFALGHKSILNTMIYANYHYSREELKKALL